MKKFGIIVALSESDDPPPTSQTETGGEDRTPVAATAESDTARIGTPVRDGDFTFTVTKVTGGPSMIGGEYLNIRPQGKFVYVYLTVENHGDEPGSFFGDNQYLYDTESRRASADSRAAIYVDDAKSLFEEINPGNRLSGIVIFNIPKDATPAKLELHDSAFSHGVTVTIN